MESEKQTIQEDLVVLDNQKITLTELAIQKQKTDRKIIEISKGQYKTLKRLQE